MSLSSWKMPPFNNPPTNGFASLLSTQQTLPVCTWSAHVPQSGPSPLPFPRSGHTLTATATATPLGDLFLFGGSAPIGRASRDLYVFSTQDFSTTLLQTGGEAPTARFAHGAALVGNTLLICGGKTDFRDQNSLYLLNLVSLEWTRVVANVPGSGCRYYHTTNVVGSKLFIFGGQIGGKVVNDMWTLDLNFLTSQPLWELCEPAPGNKKPLPRSGHVSITTEDRIIIFGGYGDQHYYNDTWSFDISTRKWTELQCTGSIPSRRSGHAAVLVDGVMYVFGGFSVDEDEGYLNDLTALQLSTLRWIKFHNEGTGPPRRSAHAMVSEGTRVFVLGGYSRDARADEISFIHVFDTKDIKYPEPEHTAVNPYEKTAQLSQRSSTGPWTQKQPLYHLSSSLEAQSASRLHNATPTSSDTTRLELERQLSIMFAAQIERDQLIQRQTDELAQKSVLLERAEADAAEEKRRAMLELREHEDRLLSHADALAEPEAETPGFETVGSGLTDADNGWADESHTVSSASFVDSNEGRDMHELKEDKQVMEAEMEMKCRNEG